MKNMRMMRLFRAFVLVMAVCLCATMVFAGGGPKNGSGTVTLTNTTESAGTYSFGYVFDSTYYGSLSSDRPNVSTNDANAALSFSNNIFTFTATSSKGNNPIGSWSDKSAQNVSTDVTITNNSGKTLVIGYSYSSSNGTTSGSNLAEGTGSLTWIPGQSIFLTVKTEVTSWTAASTTATATFKITSCEEVSDYDLKIVPSQFGSYDYAIGDGAAETLTSASAMVKTEASASDVLNLSVPVVDAAYANNYYFYGWSVNGTVTPSTEGYTGEVTTHTTIFPVFIKKGTIDASGNGPFYVNGKYYVFWRDAFLAAGSSHTVVLARDYELPATMQENGVAESDGLYIGDKASGVEYIVPYGSIFLIPGDAANTVRTTKPANAGEDTYTTPTVYRTLTMAQGANITVNGAISIYGQQGTKFENVGSPSGSVGRIQMNSGSSITVNSGANLYAWGFISGSGTVLIKNGGAVYEHFEAKEWHGGDVTSSMNNNSYRVFPVTQYYVQNIEVPMTLEAGAKEYVNLSLSITLAGVVSETFEFIGSNGIFNLSTGSLTKDYEESTDRMVFDINGEGAFSNMEISIQVTTFGKVTLKTQNYDFPLANHITMRVNSGSKLEIKNSITVLPGTQVFIENGAEITVAEGKSVYIYGKGDWVTREKVTFNSGFEMAAGTGFVYPGNGQIRPAAYTTSRGTTSPRTAAGLKDAMVQIDGTLDVSKGYIYTTETGGNICSSGTGKIITQNPAADPKLYQILQGNPDKSNKEYYWYRISVGAAKLTNADGTSQVTGADTYTYSDGAWHCTNHSYDAGQVTVNATCTTEGTKLFTCVSCGTTKTETVAALGHSHNAAVTAPTCTEAGYTTYTCACGDTYTADEVAALGHNYEAAVTAPTCTTAGYTIYTCACGDVYTADEVAALGHQYGAPTFNWNTNDYSCTATFTCGNCADGHTVTEKCTVTSKVTKFADCENQGEEDYSATVTRDGVTYTYEGERQFKYLERLGHDMNLINTVSATCSKPGYEEKDCSRCNYTQTIEFGEEDANNHVNVVDVAEVPATCTSTGWTAGKQCEDCGTFTEGHVKIPVQPHTEETINGIHATCTESGMTDGKKCSVCQNTLLDQTVIDPLGHEWENGICKHECGTTCQEHDWEDGICKVCKLNCIHSYQTEVKKPTCTEAGYTTYTCETCGHSYNGDSQNPLGHTDLVEGTKISATCNATGSVTMGCERCNYTEQVELAIDPTNHVALQKVGAKAPTCSENGWDDYEYCTDCNRTTYQEKAKLEHTDSATDKDHLCDHDCGTKMNECTDGNNDHNCDVCDTKMSDCQGGTATCTEKAVCSVCKKEYGEAKGHAFGEFESNDAGLLVATCSRCGVKKTEIDTTSTQQKEPEIEASVKQPDEGGETQNQQASVSVEKESLQKLPSLKVYSDLLNMTFNTNALTEIIKTAQQTIEFVAEKVAAQSNDTTLTFDLYLKVDGERDQKGTDFGTGSVEVSIPMAKYNLTGTKYDVWYVENGVRKENMEAEIVDGHIKFTTNHFSEYEVVEAVHQHNLSHYAEVAATCAKSGNSEYWSCDCGKYFSDAEGTAEITKDSWMIPALNHVGTTVTYTDNGDGTHDGTCSCGEVVVDNQTHSYDETTGKCSCGASMVLTDPSLTLNRNNETAPYATMMVGNEIKISVNVAQYKYNYTEYYAEFAINNNGIKITKAFPVSSDEYYVYFRFAIPAPLMTETISVTVYGVKDGVVYRGTPVEFTVKESVIAKLDATYQKYNTNQQAQKQFDLLLSLLKYGAEAQLQFNKNTDNLATDGLKAEYAALIKTDVPAFRTYPTVDESGKQAVLYNMGLKLQDKINMYGNFWVKSEFTSLSEYTIEIAHKKSNGETVNYTISSEDLSWDGYYIKFNFNEIAPSQMRDEMVITLYKNGVAVSATYTRTGDMIVNTVLSKNTALRDAIMNYADCAKALFG